MNIALSCGASKIQVISLHAHCVLGLGLEVLHPGLDLDHAQRPFCEALGSSNVNQAHVPVSFCLFIECLSEPAAVLTIIAISATANVHARLVSSAGWWSAV